MNTAPHRISLARGWRLSQTGMTRVFHAPSVDSAPYTVRLCIDSDDHFGSILLNDIPIDWCKIDSRLDCDVTKLLRPTNYLAMELQPADGSAIDPSDGNNARTFIQSPFEVWLEITGP